MLKDIVRKRYRRFKDRKGTFGIEIETEVYCSGDYGGILLPAGQDNQGHLLFEINHPKMGGWQAKTDGSLKNYGIEYVLKNPLRFEAALESLDTFSESMKEVPFIHEPKSCSVHVHVNMQYETIKTIGNFITTWLLLEDTLVHYCGETRRSNLFSLPTTLAEGGIVLLSHAFEGLERGVVENLNIHPSHGKYAALNPCCLTSFGSLEVRSMRGTTDPEVLKEWISILNKVLTFAQNPELNPRGIVEKAQTQGISFLDTVLQEFSQKAKSDLEDFEIENFMTISSFYAAVFADSVKDWDNIDAKLLEEETKPEKTASEIYLELLGQEVPAQTEQDQPYPATLSGLVAGQQLFQADLQAFVNPDLVTAAAAYQHYETGDTVSDFEEFELEEGEEY